MPAAIRFPSVLERTHRSRLACPSGSEKQVETSARGRDLGECCGLLAGETAPSTPSKKMALGDRRSGMVLGAGQKRCLGTEGGVCGVDLAVAGMEDAGSVCAPELRGCTRCLVRGAFDAGLCGGGGAPSDDSLALFEDRKSVVEGKSVLVRVDIGGR